MSAALSAVLEHEVNETLTLISCSFSAVHEGLVLGVGVAGAGGGGGGILPVSLCALRSTLQPVYFASGNFNKFIPAHHFHPDCNKVCSSAVQVLF